MVILALWLFGNMLRRYAVGASFWLDEAFIVYDVMNVPLSGMFGALPVCQQFPRLYLFIIKITGMIFGYGPYSMRILPLLFSIASMAVWFKIILKSSDLLSRRIFFMLFFTGSVMFLQYSTEIKQYSADLFWCGLLTFCYVNILRSGDEGALWRYILLGFPVLLSYTYLPVVTAILMIEFSPFGSKVFSRRSLAVLASTLAVLLLLLYRIDLVHICGGIKEFWEGAFIGRESIYQFVSSSGERWYDYLGGWFYTEWYSVPLFGTKVTSVLISLTVLTSLIGIAVLVREARSGGRHQRGLAMLAIIVSVELYVAGVLRLYPFGALRMNLFALPFAALFVSAGLAFLVNKAWSSAATVIVILPVLNILVAFPLSQIIQNLNTIDWDSPIVKDKPLLVSDCSYYQVKTYSKLEGRAGIFHHADSKLGDALAGVKPPFFYLLTHNCGELQRSTLNELTGKYRTRVMTSGSVVGFLYVFDKM